MRVRIAGRGGVVGPGVIDDGDRVVVDELREEAPDAPLGGEATQRLARDVGEWIGADRGSREREKSGSQVEGAVGRITAHPPVD